MRNAVHFTLLLAAFAFVGAGCVSSPYGLTDKNLESEVNAETGTLYEVQKVAGHKTLVNPADIVSWGQSEETLPSLYDPAYIDFDAVDAQPAEEPYLSDFPGVVVESGDTAYFYPYQILAWHEVVQEEVDGTPIVIRYSPLVGHAAVYERTLEGGQIADFETSGYVWNNDSLMVTKGTGADTLWSGILGGTAVYGSRAGEVLTPHPYEITTLDSFRVNYPEGQVLSMETGYERVYSISPYGGYMLSGTVHFPRVNEIVPALRSKTPVYGMVLDGHAKAFEEGEFGRRGVVVINQTIGEEDFTEEELEASEEDLLADRRIVVWVSDTGIIYAHKRNTDQAFVNVSGETLTDAEGDAWTVNATGDLENASGEVLARVPMQRMYWFAWSTTHQSSELFGYIPNRGEVDGVIDLQAGQGVKEGDQDIEITVDPAFEGEATPVEEE